MTPSNYDAARVIEHEVERQLLSRLSWVKLQPKTIVDIGCGLGTSAHALKSIYPEATIIGLDLNPAMLDFAKENQHPDLQWLCNDTASLPFLTDSVDLIVSNLMLPWVQNVHQVLLEWARILRPEGLCVFTTYGLDTLKALNPSHLQLFDMHDIGDALLQQGWSDPVLDVDRLNLQYKSWGKLNDELLSTGMLPHPIQNAEKIIPQLTYEIIYAHAWGGAPRKPHKISLESLRDTLRKD